MEAEEEEVQMMRISREALGEEHPGTLSRMETLYRRPSIFSSISCIRDPNTRDYL